MAARCERRACIDGASSLRRPGSNRLLDVRPRARSPGRRGDEAQEVAVDLALLQHGAGNSHPRIWNVIPVLAGKARQPGSARLALGREAHRRPGSGASSVAQLGVTSHPRRRSSPTGHCESTVARRWTPIARSATGRPAPGSPSSERRCRRNEIGVHHERERMNSPTGPESSSPPYLTAAPPPCRGRGSCVGAAAVGRPDRGRAVRARAARAP